MPTGYTYDIANGITFQQFALNCSRAFGALVMMRDDPADAQIPDVIQPSDYHVKRLAEARQKLAEIRAITAEEAEVKAQEAYDRACAGYTESNHKDDVLLQKYEAMLSQVEAWTPPTSEHEGLKKFMAEQITESMRFDCSHNWRKPPVKLTGEEWRAQEIEIALRDVDYHEQEYAKEVGRCRERTEWIQALKTSLGVPVGELVSTGG